MTRKLFRIRVTFLFMNIYKNFNLIIVSFSNFYLSKFKSDYIYIFLELLDSCDVRSIRSKLYDSIILIDDSLSLSLSFFNHIAFLKISHAQHTPSRLIVHSMFTWHHAFQFPHEFLESFLNRNRYPNRNIRCFRPRVPVINTTSADHSHRPTICHIIRSIFIIYHFTYSIYVLCLCREFHTGIMIFKNDTLKHTKEFLICF